MRYRSEKLKAWIVRSKVSRIDDGKGPLAECGVLGDRHVVERDDAAIAEALRDAGGPRGVAEPLLEHIRYSRGVDYHGG